MLAGTDSSSVDALLQLSAAERLRRTSSGGRASLDRASLRRGGAGGGGAAAAALAGLGGDGGGFPGGGASGGGDVPPRARSQDAWSHQGSGPPHATSALGRAGSGVGAPGGGAAAATDGRPSLAHVSVGAKEVELPTTDGGPLSHLQLTTPRTGSGGGDAAAGGAHGGSLARAAGSLGRTISSDSHRSFFGGWRGGGKGGGASSVGGGDASHHSSNSAGDHPGDTAGAQPTGAQLDGSMLQHRLMNSEAWAEHKQLLDHYAVPAPGAQPPKFDSVFARTFPYQLRTTVGRRFMSYYRNTKYNFTRIAILLAMQIIFGVIYYKASCVSPCMWLQNKSVKRLESSVFGCL